MAYNGNNRDEFKAKCYEVAYNYVNICAGNKSESLKKYYLDHGEVMPKYLRSTSHEFFKHALVKQYVEQFREENRKQLVHAREENIAMLKDIASSIDSNSKDKVAAIKELNSMCGYNQHNVNVDAKTKIIIDIEE